MTHSPPYLIAKKVQKHFLTVTLGANTQLVKVLYCKPPTNGMQLPAFLVDVRPLTSVEVKVRVLHDFLQPLLISVKHVNKTLTWEARFSVAWESLLRVPSAG